jgi:hypothetical protein
MTMDISSREKVVTNLLLEQIIESTKAWRDAWVSILTYQGRLVHEFEEIYAPIIGSSEPSDRSNSPILTPQNLLSRTSRLHEEYESLRTDLLDEVHAVDDRIINPAQKAKDMISPLKKTIKKREDKKVGHPGFSIFLAIVTNIFIPFSWISSTSRTGLITL